MKQISHISCSYITTNALEEVQNKYQIRNPKITHISCHLCWAYVQTNKQANCKRLYVMRSLKKFHTYFLQLSCNSCIRRSSKTFSDSFFDICRNFNSDLPNLYLLISCNMEIFRRLLWMTP